MTGAKVGEVRNDGVDRYLARIGYTGRRAPTVNTLRKLQLGHLINVPFENLDVFHRRGVRVDVNWSFQKIVARRRGGWCYELNGCFGALLEQLGYRVARLSSRTFEPGTGGLSADFDHLALLVRVGTDRYLVDVGWGDCALRADPRRAGRVQDPTAPGSDRDDRRLAAPHRAGRALRRRDRVGTAVRSVVAPAGARRLRCP